MWLIGQLCIFQERLRLRRTLHTTTSSATTSSSTQAPASDVSHTTDAEDIHIHPDDEVAVDLNIHDNDEDEEHANFPLEDGP